MRNAIKYATCQFIKENKLINVSYESLKVSVEKLGYTIVLYNSIENTNDVATIIESLCLNNVTANSRGFTYVNKNFRLIFINENLSDNEKLIVLSHELGHIVCNHLENKYILGKDVKDENEANEFSHYLLHQDCFQRLKNIVYKHKKVAICIVVTALLVCLAIMVSKIVTQQNSYYGEYFVTSTGNKYHRKDCIFVKDKKTIKRLTKEEFNSGKYTPCDICLPDN